MSTGLQLRQADEMNLAELQTLGQVLAKSGFFAETKDAAQAVVKVMAGMELGFPAIASMTGVYIVKGKVSLSANLMAAAIQKSQKYNYRVRQLDDKGCKIEFFEDGASVGFSEFTRADAQNAGLAGSDTYKKFFRNMVFARAMSNGAKWYCPEIFSGPVYTPDELGAEVDGETGEVITLPAEDAGQIEPPADESNAPYAGFEHAILEPDPAHTVKLEGAQPTDKPWPTHKKYAPVFGKCEALKFSHADLANYIQLKFKLAVSEDPVTALDALSDLQLKDLNQALAGEFQIRNRTK